VAAVFELDLRRFEGSETICILRKCSGESERLRERNLKFGVCVGRETADGLSEGDRSLISDKGSLHLEIVES
jgi:hypothetical protein